MNRRLFTSGTARGGTNLLAQALSVNENITLASDPYLPLFKQLRNAILINSQDPEIVANLRPEAPIDDYYFSRTKLRMMERIQAADLDVPYDEEERSRLIDALTKRTALSSADLLPYLSLLSGQTFTEVFTNALDIIKKARNVHDDSWIGFNENWVLEFFPLMARAFPNSNFIIILRDPRAAIGSAMRDNDPLKIPHVLSFARAWRKYVALSIHFTRDPLFDNRLFVLTYEELVRAPQKCLEEIVTFLGVPFDSAMLDADNFRDPSGGKWVPNSHYDTPPSGIFSSSVDAWTKYLSPEIVETVEFVCDPDMETVGYAPTVYQSGGYPGAGCLQFISTDSDECLGWRTDFGDMEHDVGSELLRKTMLGSSGTRFDGDLIQRCFLYREVYELLSENRGVNPPVGLWGTNRIG